MYNKGSGPKPDVFPEFYFGAIPNNPPITIFGRLSSPHHPFPEFGNTCGFTVKDVGGMCAVFVIYNSFPTLPITSVVSFNPGS